MPFLEMKQRLAEKVAECIAHPSVTRDTVLNDMSSPPNLALGYLAFPCFALSKHLKRASNQIATELAAKIQEEGFFAVATGPYVNIKWDIRSFLEQTCRRIDTQKERYGEDKSGSGKKIIVEYCSPNIAKKLAFHHIRSTLIGATLSNFYRALGYETHRMNFVGDWGSQFARLLAAFELWGVKEKLSEPTEAAMAHLAEIYVRFHKEIETHPEHLNLANECLARLEAGDEKTVALWKDIRMISLRAMNNTLARLHIEFDHVEGESDYVQGTSSTLEEVKKKAQARLSEGAWIVDVEGIETPALIQKTDGTTLYLTRDIAAALDRYERFHFDQSFYVVSAQQKLHFELLFGVLKKMGHAWADHCKHLAFGTVLFGAGKMSTREGNVVLLDDILNEARDRALAECTAKNPALVNKNDVAEKVGIGAIIFGELSSHIGRDIQFDWEKILSLDGETGPYVQYAVVRCNSLLKKAAEMGAEPTDLVIPPDYDFTPEEEALILSLARLRSTLHQAIFESEPFHLPRYLIELTKNFSRFYNRLSVLQTSDVTHRNLRLHLVRATRQVLNNGLQLLGIEAPEEM